MDGQNVIINNLLTQSYTPNNEVITIIVTNVKNPSSTQPPTFTLQSIDNNYVIDSITNYVMITTLNPDPIIAFNTNLIMTAIALFTNGIGNYSFSFLTTNSIPQNGQIVITFPSSIQINSSTTCSNLQNFISTPTCLVTANNQIVIQNGFTTGASNSKTIPINFTLNSITNPRSLFPSDSVIIQTNTNTNYTIDIINTGLSVIVQAASSFDPKSTLSPSSTINGAQTTYTFTLYPYILPINSDYFVFSFPSEIILVQGVTGCQSTSSNIISITTCTIDTVNNQITIQANFGTISQGDNLVILITNIINQGVTSTSNLISVSHYDLHSSLVETNSNPFTITTSSPAQFPNPLLVMNSQLIGTNTTYTFTIINSLTIPSNGYLKITFPSDFNTQQAIVSQISSNLGMAISNQISTGVFSISNLTQVNSGTNFSFTISNIINPQNNTNNYVITVASFTQTSQIIESSLQLFSYVYSCATGCTSCSLIYNNCTACYNTTPLLYNSSCYIACPDGSVNFTSSTCTQCATTSNCKTCTTSNLASCTSCGALYPFISTVNSVCYSICPAGQYFFAGTTCKPCDPSSYCQTCSSTNASICLSCSLGNNYSFLSFDNKCYSTCPIGSVSTINSNGFGVCLQCDQAASCQTCDVLNLKVCKTCPSSAPYLSGLDNRCYTSCPQGTVFQQNTQNPFFCAVCQSSSNCLTCDPQNSSKCLSCPSNYPMLNLNNSVCLPKCQSGSTLSGSYCIPCNANCQECAAGLPNNCTSCTTSIPFFSQQDNRCYLECPLGTFLNASTCQICNSSCKACQGNSTSCTVCPTGLYLFGITCISVCPTDYIPLNSTCYSKNCAVGCSYCLQNGSCSKCQTGFFTFNNSCISTCPSQFFPFVSNSTCGQCQMANCSNCTESAPQNCSMCTSGLTLSPNKSACIQGCSVGYFPLNGICSLCSSGCASCSNQTQCAVCLTGFTLNNGICGIIQAKAQAIVPVPFLLLSITIVSGLLVVEYKKRDNLFFNNAMAILSSIEILAWIVLMALFFVEGFFNSGMICVCGLLLNWLFNVIFYIIYKKLIVDKDVSYNEWRYKCLKQVKILEYVSYSTSIKFLRLGFGRLVAKEWTYAVFANEQVAKNIFNNFCLASLLVINFPILLSNYLSFSSVLSTSQLYYSAIETSILSIGMIAFSVLSYTIFANDGFKQGNLVNDSACKQILQDVSVDHNDEVDTKDLNNILIAIDMPHHNNNHFNSLKGSGNYDDFRIISPNDNYDDQPITSDHNNTAEVKLIDNDLAIQTRNDLSINVIKKENLTTRSQIDLKPNDLIVEETANPSYQRRFSEPFVFDISNIFGLESPQQRYSSENTEFDEYIQNMRTKKRDLACITEENTIQSPEKQAGFYCEEKVSKGKMKINIKEKLESNMNNLNTNINNDLFNEEEFEMSYKDDELMTCNQTKYNRKSISVQRQRGPLTKIDDNDVHNIILEQYSETECDVDPNNQVDMTKKLTELNIETDSDNNSSIDDNDHINENKLIDKKGLITKNSSKKSKKKTMKSFESPIKTNSPKRTSPNISKKSQDPNTIQTNYDKENHRDFATNSATRKRTQMSAERMSNPKNDVVQRLMKMTVINNDYKRDLLNNQIVKKSYFGFDQLQKNPQNQVEIQKMHSTTVNQLQEIEKRNTRGMNNFMSPQTVEFSSDLNLNSSFSDRFNKSSKTRTRINSMSPKNSNGISHETGFNYDRKKNEDILVMTGKLVAQSASKLPKKLPPTNSQDIRVYADSNAVYSGMSNLTRDYETKTHPIDQHSNLRMTPESFNRSGKDSREYQRLSTFTKNTAEELDISYL